MIRSPSGRAKHTSAEGSVEPQGQGRAPRRRRSSVNQTMDPAAALLVFGKSASPDPPSHPLPAKLARSVAVATAAALSKEKKKQRTQPQKPREFTPPKGALLFPSPSAGNGVVDARQSVVNLTGSQTVLGAAPTPCMHNHAADHTQCKNISFRPVMDTSATNREGNEGPTAKWNNAVEEWYLNIQPMKYHANSNKAHLAFVALHADQQVMKPSQMYRIVALRGPPEAEGWLTVSTDGSQFVHALFSDPGIWTATIELENCKFMVPIPTQKDKPEPRPAPSDLDGTETVPKRRKKNARSPAPPTTPAPAPAASSVLPDLQEPSFQTMPEEEGLNCVASHLFSARATGPVSWVVQDRNCPGITFYWTNPPPFGPTELNSNYFVVMSGNRHLLTCHSNENSTSAATITQHDFTARFPASAFIAHSIYAVVPRNDQSLETSSSEHGASSDTTVGSLTITPGTPSRGVSMSDLHLTEEEILEALQKATSAEHLSGGNMVLEDEIFNATDSADTAHFPSGYPLDLDEGGIFEDDMEGIEENRIETGTETVPDSVMLDAGRRDPARLDELIAATKDLYKKLDVHHLKVVVWLKRGSETFQVEGKFSLRFVAGGFKPDEVFDDEEHIALYERLYAILNCSLAAGCALLVFAPTEHDSIVSEILESGDYDVREKVNGTTSLHWAAAHGSIKVVKAILKHPTAEAALSVRDALGLTPRLVAMLMGRTDVAELLLPGFSERKVESDVRSAVLGETPPVSQRIKPEQPEESVAKKQIIESADLMELPTTPLRSIHELSSRSGDFPFSSFGTMSPGSEKKVPDDMDSTEWGYLEQRDSRRKRFEPPWSALLFPAPSDGSNNGVVDKRQTLIFIKPSHRFLGKKPTSCVHSNDPNHQTRCQRIAVQPVLDTETYNFVGKKVAFVKNNDAGETCLEISRMKYSANANKAPLSFVALNNNSALVELSYCIVALQGPTKGKGYLATSENGSYLVDAMFSRPGPWVATITAGDCVYEVPIPTEKSPKPDRKRRKKNDDAHISSIAPEEPDEAIFQVMPPQEGFSFRNTSQVLSAKAEGTVFWNSVDENVQSITFKWVTDPPPFGPSPLTATYAVVFLGEQYLFTCVSGENSTPAATVTQGDFCARLPPTAFLSRKIYDILHPTSNSSDSSTVISTDMSDRFILPDLPLNDDAGISEEMLARLQETIAPIESETVSLDVNPDPARFEELVQATKGLYASYRSDEPVVTVVVWLRRGSETYEVQGQFNLRLFAHTSQ